MWFPVVQLEPWFQMRFSCANWLSYDLVPHRAPRHNHLWWNLAPCRIEPTTDEEVA